MAPDDEILFGHVADDVQYSFERVGRLAHQAEGGDLSPDFALAIAEFELHGATLRSLLRWYPDETRVRDALADWELSSVEIGAYAR